MGIIDIKKILNSQKEQIVEIIGWVKTNRDSGKIGFLSINDGSCIENIQVVYKREITKDFDNVSQIRTGSAIYISGKSVKTNKADQPLEVIADQVKLLKNANEDYPLQKKQHSFEFLRDIAHLRPKTTTIGAVMKIRSELAFLVHKFFNENGFIWLSAPIITSNDAEGAGECFEIVNNDFFSKKPVLSVSGQLTAEAYAQAFKKVYTFGPTFRAEKSHTNRHLAEFWMIEPEIAFLELNELMELIQVLLQFLAKQILTICSKEIKALSVNKPNLTRQIETLANNNFAKMTHAEAIKHLQNAIKNGHKFEDNEINDNKDLATEHEKYLCDEVIKGPVFIYNFPKSIKPFYMKDNNDGTVAACDLLVPGIGELVGGSQREDSYEKISQRLDEMNIDKANLQWYLDLRKYGYYLSSGFGIGFERLVMYFSGMDNIKDVIPFPRSNGELKF